MPSITSSGEIHFSPIGLIATTFQPASRNAPSSIHTRRSNGSGRFSERWRSLPGEPMVFPARDTPGIDGVHEIDERLPGLQQGTDLAILLGAVSDHHDFAALDDLLHRAPEPLGQVRH